MRILGLVIVIRGLLLLDICGRTTCQFTAQVAGQLRQELANRGVICSSNDTTSLVATCGLQLASQQTSIAGCQLCGAVNVTIVCVNAAMVSMHCTQNIASNLAVLPAVLDQLLGSGSCGSVVCDPIPHLVVPAWSDSTALTECSATCGGGSQTLSHQCSDIIFETPLPEVRCDGPAVYEAMCNPQACITAGTKTTTDSAAGTKTTTESAAVTDSDMSNTSLAITWPAVSMGGDEGGGLPNDTAYDITTAVTDHAPSLTDHTPFLNTLTYDGTLTTPSISSSPRIHCRPVSLTMTVSLYCAIISLCNRGCVSLTSG